MQRVKTTFMKIHCIQHVHFESPGTILDWAAEKNATVTYTNVYKNDPYPASLDFDLLVIMGGPMSVNDEAVHPWLVEEKKFIRLALEAKQKVVGICLGAQLLASVLGARVYANAEKEIGWWPIEKNTATDHHLVKYWPPSWTCFHWHGDTYDLPHNATLLFSTPACVNQGFIYLDHALGLQFHMEATPQLVHAMVEHGSDELKPGKFIQDEKTILTGQGYYQFNKTLLFAMLSQFCQSDKAKKL
jgi:GMP synthase-like glutamine amidotransferase